MAVTTKSTSRRVALLLTGAAISAAAALLVAWIAADLFHASARIVFAIVFVLIFGVSVRSLLHAADGRMPSQEISDD